MNRLLIMVILSLSCLYSPTIALAYNTNRATRKTLLGFSTKASRTFSSSRLSPLAAGKIEYEDFENIDGSRLNSSPPISWYPGHIAKAERELSDYLKKVDVVIEVRDARIPLSTTHPMVPEWVGNR